MDTTSRSRTFGRMAWMIAAALWLTATSAGLVIATAYAGRPGASARAPSRWPAGSTVERRSGRATLLMFAHSQCACTRASLRELERAMARADERIDAHVLFVNPRSGVTPVPRALDLRATAREIPGVHVVEDEEEVRRFGALTSGQLLVYDEAGALIFQGGITAARGHEGASKGGEAVVRIATGSGATSASSDVFGCSLFKP